ncbi:helix-turn-helix domain-containing protein [Bailinhaonella thermotolerans]|uniref:helix-turn-helix domain-containing protein n=1 Tax=Bailinhaonella thermotolerans TaxID=1070861 RepID=UPI001F5B8E8C|nr:helix-turn-helix transcriptional regulator [Bailinhaonella thermotolerans]
MRALRLNRRLSQAQLAGPDLSDSYVSLIESGKRMPTPAVVRLLAERLGCTADFLLHGVEPRQRIDAEYGLRHAELELRHGDALAAAERFAAIAASESEDNPAVAAMARLGHARALESAGRLPEAVRAYEELRQEAAHHPERFSDLSLIVALCRCYRVAGDVLRARELGSAALEVAERLDLVRGQDAIQLASALVATEHDSGVANAVPYAERVLLAAQPVQAVDRSDEINVLWDTSLRAASASEPALAIKLADEAVAASTHAGTSVDLARLALGCARIALRGEPPRIQRAEEFADLAQRSLAEPAHQAMCLTILARVKVLMANPSEAVPLARRALQLAGGTPRVETASAHTVLGMALMADSDERAAADSLQTAAGHLEELPRSREVAKAWKELGDLFSRIGYGEASASAYRNALHAVGLRPAMPFPDTSLAAAHAAS